MKILVDTHCWLWLQTEPARFPTDLLQRLELPTTTICFSVASGWEIAIKHGLGKLPLPKPPAEYLPNRLRATGSSVLDITMAHALEIAELPLHHRDPFDRLLVAQARVEGLPILTADKQLIAYDVELVFVS